MARPCRSGSHTAGLVSRRWSLFGWDFGWGDEPDDTPVLDDPGFRRFQSYAEGEGASARMQREGLRSLLECTDNSCLTKHWLPDSFLAGVYNQYALEDGISFKEYKQIARDGLLLEGKLEEYEKAFNGVDTEGEGFITRSQLGQLFAGLGRMLPPDELDRIVDEADVGHDGIDIADFLGLARTHLFELSEVLRYIETKPKSASELPVDLADPRLQPGAGLSTVTTVHGEAELGALVQSGADTIVKLAFTWCRPCKGFWPKYQKFAKVYSKTRFLRIVGNENQSCKHYAREVLKAKISPMFAAYSGGKLVTTWTGANTGRFIENMEKSLPTAQELTTAREAAVAADTAIAPV